MPNTILILGGSGFIGSRLYDYFKKKSIDVKGTYCKNYGEMDKGDRLFLDLSKDTHVDINVEEITHIVMCHGISKIDECKKNRQLSYLINVANTIKFLTQFENTKAVPIFISTDMVYEGNKENPSELNTPKPNTEYGRQKLLVEEYIRKKFAQYIILRLTKTYGVEKRDKSIFTSWLDRLLAGEKILGAYDSFISPVYIYDVIEALSALMSAGYSGVYNFGGSETMSIYKLASKFADFFNYNPSCIEKKSIRDFNFAERRPKYNSVDSAKIKKLLRKDTISYTDSFAMIKRNYGIH